jgi:hypothetical protein
MQTLITIADLRKYTPASFNLDGHWLNGQIEICEAEYIVNCLGQEFYDELLLQVNTNTLTPDNINLMDAYLRFVLSWYVVSTSVMYVHTRIENKGIVINTNDTSQSASLSAVNALSQSALNQAQTWRKHMINFLNKNILLYPLFKSSSECCCDKVGCDFEFDINI